MELPPGHTALLVPFHGIKCFALEVGMNRLSHILHPVHVAVLAPSPERLSLVVEENAKQAPKRNE